MCNPKITFPNYSIEQAVFPLSLEEGTSVPLPKKASPTFIPYNNQQGFAIFGIQDLVPANHVARVIDEMVELIDDELFFAHYKGGGRSSFHPKMMTKVILYAYSKKRLPNIFRPCGSQSAYNRTTVQLTGSVPTT